jgi:CBS domain-containing protein
MQASDVMTRDVVTATPAMTVYEAAAKMLERRVSALPVVDEAGRLVGIVSEGDLLHRAETGTERRRSWWLDLFASTEERAREFVKSRGVRVEDVMTRNVRVVAPDTRLDEIAATLERHSIKRLPVVENDQLVGVVSRADLLRGLAIRKLAPAPGGQVPDAELRQKVEAAMRDLVGAPWQVNAVVDGGVVHLWGIVASDAERRALRVAAERVPGVVRVENDVTVAPHLLHGAE